MASLNKVLLIGNLTRDPEVRMLPSGRSVCKFGLAINRNFKDAEGNRREETTFIDVESFGPRGEALARFFSKGKPIFVEGRLKLDQWESQTGEKRSKLLVDLENWEFMGAKQDSYEGQPRAPDSGTSQAQATRVAPDNGNTAPDSPSPRASEPDLNEDVPF
jgi:single-strand DNA-binding protein